MNLKPLAIGVLFGAALASFVLPAPKVTAQGVGQGTGVYAPVGRSNDPFVFCTEGVPLHGWIAVDPISGTWTPISKYVNYQWIPTYVAICPRAMKRGVWKGSRPANMTPFSH